MYAFARLRDRVCAASLGGRHGARVRSLGGGSQGLAASAAPSVRRVAVLADELARARVAVPGELTTAALLADLFTGGLARPVFMPFDRIMPAVAAGEVDAGVIIHEGRFTFGSYGLRRLVDLGEWWEDTTGLPIPLGGIAVSACSWTGRCRQQVERAVRASVEHARAHPEAAGEYVRAALAGDGPDGLPSSTSICT